MEISVVVPVYNESDNIPILETEIRKVLTSSGLSWECIWVDDASQDSSWQEIKKLEFPNRGISLKNQSLITIISKYIQKFGKGILLWRLLRDLWNFPA